MYEAGTEYGAGPGMGALRRGLGPGELLKIELDEEFERGRYVPSLPGIFDGGGIPVEDCEDIL